MNISKRIHILANGSAIPATFLAASKSAAAELEAGSEKSALEAAIAGHETARRKQAKPATDDVG